MRGYKDTVAMIKQILIKKMFWGICLGHFLDLKDNKFSKMLVYSFILRELNKGNLRDELLLKVNAGDIKFSLYKFVIMTSLQLSVLIDIEMYLSSDAIDRL